MQSSGYDRVLTAVLVMVIGGASLWAQAGKAGQSSKPIVRQKPRTYVGSEVCAECHSDIAQSYLKTDMGRSVYLASPASLSQIPTTASIFDQRANRHFEVFSKEGSLFQSEYQTAEDGQEVFRDTRK